jgi:HD-like signal output (HDOD) protein
MDAAYNSAFDFVKKLGKELTHNSFDLPPFPENMMRVREALYSPEISLGSVAQVIQSDPLLTVRLLRMANSAMLRRSPVAIIDLKMAISRLGLEMVRNTAISIAMDQTFKVPKDSPVYKIIEETRMHCSHVGALSYLLTKRYQPRLGTDEGMLAGLVHDIGKFYILTRIVNYPELYEDPLTMNGVLQDWHPAIGRAIIDTWEFPDAIAEAADEHELLEREHYGAADITDIVIVANQLAHLDINDSEAYQTLLLLPPFRKVGLGPDDLKIFLEESNGEISSITAALG